MDERFIKDVYSQRVIAQLLALDPMTTDSRDWPWVNKIIYEEDKPLLWAEICRQAEAMANDPILKIWFLLEHINGFRRQGGFWDIQHAVRHLNETKKLIEALPDDHPRKLRLLEMWAYHSGWVYRPAGEFTFACRAHYEESKTAILRGDKKAELIANHNYWLALMEICVMVGYLSTEVFELFSEANTQCLAALSLTDRNDLRWRANILCHQAWYDFLVKRQKTNKDVFEILIQTAEILNITEFADIYILFRACNAYVDKNYPEVLEYVGKINDTLAIYWRSYALVLRALALEKAGRSNEADVLKQRIINLPKSEHNCHLAGAILEHGLIK